MCQAAQVAKGVQPATADNSILRKESASSNEDDMKNKGETNDTTKLVLAQQTLEKGTILSCASLLLLITGASLTFPHMQSQRDTLGCDSLCYGSMTSLRGALGLVGTAVIGRLSDCNGTILAKTLGSLGASRNPYSASSGRRACLYLGTLASLAGFVVAASMNTLTGLWLSIIPGALLQHNFDVFKALLSEYHNDIDQIQIQVQDESNNHDKENDDGIIKSSSSSSRSGSVGKLGMAAGISFMIGPMVAAVAATTFQSATYLAIICTLVSGIVIYQLPLPVVSAGSNSTNKQREENNNDFNQNELQKETNNAEFTIKKMLKLQTPKSRAAVTLLILRLNMALAFHIFNTIWPASLKARFHFGPTDHARFMSFIGVTYAFSQGFLAKRVIKSCGSKGKIQVIMACCAILGVGRYIAYSTSSIYIVYAAFLFIINALGVLNTIVTADTGAIAPSNELGGLFGALQASESAAGMLGPFLGGVISYYFGDDGGTSAPLMAVLCIYGFLFIFVYWGYERWVICCKINDKGSNSSDEKKAKKVI